MRTASKILIAKYHIVSDSDLEQVTELFYSNLHKQGDCILYEYSSDSFHYCKISEVDLVTQELSVCIENCDYVTLRYDEVQQCWQREGYVLYKHPLVEKVNE